MEKTPTNIDLDQCPQCGVTKPLLIRVWESNREEFNRGVYLCTKCKEFTLVEFDKWNNGIFKFHPEHKKISPEIKGKAFSFLKQAKETMHAPSGSIMLSNSAIDDMLKQKGYEKGRLVDRIDQAADEHLITKDMALWAHEVRFESNDERHADKEEKLPSTEEANLLFEFAMAFAEYLFVLPARIKRGKEASKPKQKS